MQRPDLGRPEKFGSSQECYGDTGRVERGVPEAGMSCLATRRGVQRHELVLRGVDTEIWW